jgi:hypothetical protein
MSSLVEQLLEQLEAAIPARTPILSSQASAAQKPWGGVLVPAEVIPRGWGGVGWCQLVILVQTHIVAYTNRWSYPSSERVGILFGDCATADHEGKGKPNKTPGIT